MTSRKIKHAAAVAKRDARIAAEKAEGLAALSRSRDRLEQKMFEKEREENKKKAAKAIKDMARDKNPELDADMKKLDEAFNYDLTRDVSRGY